MAQHEIILNDDDEAVLAAMVAVYNAKTQQENPSAPAQTSVSYLVMLLDKIIGPKREEAFNNRAIALIARIKSDAVFRDKLKLFIAANPPT